jgi:parallel beta-helix repeat protein
MSALSIQPTYPIFTDIDGQPLEAGYVWIGQANLDPQVNPINVYWDAALSIPATQPVRTLGGYPSRNGTPARLYVNSDYSIRVQNRNGSTVYSAPAATERYSADLIAFTGFNGQVGTVQNLADDDGSDWIGYEPLTGTPLSVQEHLRAITNASTFGEGANLIGFTQSNPTAFLTDAVERTVQSKLRDWISVTDFGAVADGIINTGAGTDNAVAFQNAIDSLATGGVLYVPQGIYKVGSQLTLPDNFIILGQGAWNTSIFAPAAFNGDGLIKLTGATGLPSGVFNIAITAQVGGAGASSIGIHSVKNGVYLRDLWVSGFKTNIKLDNTSNFIYDSVIEECLSGGTGLQIADTSVIVSNIQFYRCYVGILISSVAYLDATISLNNLQFIDGGYRGIDIDSSSNIQINGCSTGSSFANFGASGIYANNSSNISIVGYVGRLNVQSTTGSGVYLNNCTNVNISNSQCFNWQYGIRVGGSYSVVVNGNICSNNYIYGIYLDGGGRITASNNVCLSEGSAAITDTGIYSDNTAANSLHIINSNICSQEGGGTQEYGIYASITNNGASSGYTNIVGNICKYNTTANISKNGVTANIGDTGNLV